MVVYPRLAVLILNELGGYVPKLGKPKLFSTVKPELRLVPGPYLPHLVHPVFTVPLLPSLTLHSLTHLGSFKIIKKEQTHSELMVNERV